MCPMKLFIPGQAGSEGLLNDPYFFFSPLLRVQERPLDICCLWKMANNWLAW